MKQRLADYVFLFLVASAIVALDQACKLLVRVNLMQDEIFHPELWVSQYVRFVHLKNSGAAIGLLPGFGDIFMFLSALICVAVLYYYARIPHQQWLLRLSMALVLGGAVGNLVDRMQQGYVTDFISVLNLPVFNLADLSVLTGFILLFFDLWRKEQRKGMTQNAAPKGGESGNEEHSGRNLTSYTSLEDARSG
ncbi:MAG: signal peptidase II [Chloroflexi bacterium RBG_16_57_11]|nr:MAG: signal peptidase II [Chloroflexi bacterium RBG_16_57_11]